MQTYFVGLFLGIVSGFWIGRAFQYWVSECQTHTHK